MSHYAEVESQCNEPRYVDACVAKTEIPGKFRPEMEQLGVVFKQSPPGFDYEKFTESGVPCTLPAGWTLSAGSRSNILCLKNADGKVVFAASVRDTRGYHCWTKQ